MKIFVVSRNTIKKMHKKDPIFHKNNWIISIFSSEMEDQSSSYSPIPNAPTVLKLKFDDVTEKDTDWSIHFNKNHASKIISFIKDIKDDGTKDFFVHCDAGISRSGAVGVLLNEWFNKFIANKKDDDEFFKQTNSHIMPNSEVLKILKREMFGTPFMNIPVNDFEFDSDGNKIDNISFI